MPQPTLLMCRRAPGRGPLVLAVLLAGLMLLLLPSARAHADSFTVDSLKDESGPHYYCANQIYTNKGVCTLRIAISASNANGRPNNIYLKKGDYFLTRALPPITSAMMIQGERADLTVIFGRHEIGNRFSVFHVCGSRVDSSCPSQRPGNLSLHEVTIREGGSDSGGGLHNAGVLEVHNSIIEHNGANLDGAGIYNSARLSLYNTTVRNNNRR